MLRISFSFNVVIAPDSLKLWKSRGSTSLHSIDVGMCGLEITVRWVAKASHRIKINIRSAVIEISDPREDTTFHFMKASG